jgi:FkbM family methyltransferase
VFLARKTLSSFNVLKKSALIRFVVQHPRKWSSALRLGVALPLKLNTVRIASDGIWLFCGTTRGAGIWCALTGLKYEKELTQFLGFLNPGEVFVDIGANIGTYAIRAAKCLGHTGMVFAFEPLEANLARLNSGVRANGVTNIEVVAAAIGDRDAMVSIHDGGRESSASIGHTTGRSFDVRMVTLDRFYQSIGMKRLDWIKMDIEGQEPVALAGMSHVIDAFRPNFLFENHEGGAETCRLLQELGYRIGHFDQVNGWQDGMFGENLFAIATEKLVGFSSVLLKSSKANQV